MKDMPSLWKYPHHIIIKILEIENKETILKDVKEKGQVTHRRRPIQIIGDFSLESQKPE